MRVLINLILVLFTSNIFGEQMEMITFKEYGLQQLKKLDISFSDEIIIDGISEEEDFDISFLDSKTKRNLQILIFLSKYVYLDSILNILLNFPMQIKKYISKYSLTFNIDITPNKEKLLLIYTYRF